MTFNIIVKDEDRSLERDKSLPIARTIEEQIAQDAWRSRNGMVREDEREEWNRTGYKPDA